MNEQNPSTPPIEAVPPPAYKDRSTGLIIFGILTLLLGCLAGLFVPLMLVSAGTLSAAEPALSSGTNVTLSSQEPMTLARFQEIASAPVIWCH